MRVLSRMRRMGQRLRGTVRRQGAILLYHRVAEVEHDPWSLVVRPAHFAEHMEVLRRRARPRPLASLVTDLHHGTPLPWSSVAVTFDDGYADNFSCALPLLERFEVPATMFVVTGGIEGRRPFWWDELASLVLHAPSLPGGLHLTVRGLPHPRTVPETAAHTGSLQDFRGSEGRLRAYHAIWHVLHPLDADDQQHVLAQLREALHPELTPEDQGARLSIPDVTALAANPLIEIGAHTVTHPSLSHQTPERQQSEIGESKRYLEAVVGAPVTSFSYPFGRVTDYTPQTATLVREAGFACACVNHSGPVTLKTDRYRLPRVYISDMDGDRFESLLRHWLPRT